MIRPDMPYRDRFALFIKDFGRKIVIKVNRGYAEVSEGGKLVTISYPDAKLRGPRKKAK